MRLDGPQTGFGAVVVGGIGNAGKGVANPIGQIWCASMMLEHLGEQAAADSVMRGIEDVLSRGGNLPTPDLGRDDTTVKLGAAVAETLRLGR